jgi:murein L,D-transpeptidase YafK
LRVFHRRTLMEGKNLMHILPSKSGARVNASRDIARRRDADRRNIKMNVPFSLGNAPRRPVVALAALSLAAAVSGCSDTHSSRASQPLSRQMLALMETKGVTPSSPTLIRGFKKESEFEVWKMRPDGTYVLLKTFPICRWSGQLGPKRHEGDRQSPEGFYSITPAMMNPESHYYLSLNVGYPNAYDRAHGATGGSVMVHGICSSAGCFAMTDAQIADIYALARESFAGGQRAIQMQSYPFHMDARNLAKYRLDPNMPFWKELKKGDDHFEATKHDVSYAICGKHYMFGAQAQPGETLDASAPCPSLKYDAEVERQVAAREGAEKAEVAEIVAKGERPVRLVYKDGAQNPVFANRIAEVSRPDALVPPVEIWMDAPRNGVHPEKDKVAKTRKMAANSDPLLVAEAQARAKPQTAPNFAASPSPTNRISALVGSF